MKSRAYRGIVEYTPQFNRKPYFPPNRVYEFRIFSYEACYTGENHFTIDFHSDNSCVRPPCVLNFPPGQEEEAELYLRQDSYARKKDPCCLSRSV